MTNSASSFMAVIFGLGVFAIIMAVGWRSVQNRRILRLQGAHGEETIIVAQDGDEISSVTTTTETTQCAPPPAPSVVVLNNSPPKAVAPPESGRSPKKGALEREANESAPRRLSRVIASTK